MTDIPPSNTTSPSNVKPMTTVHWRVFLMSLYLANVILPHFRSITYPATSLLVGSMPYASHSLILLVAWSIHIMTLCSLSMVIYEAVIQISSSTTNHSIQLSI